MLMWPGSYLTDLPQKSHFLENTFQSPTLPLLMYGITLDLVKGYQEFRAICINGYKKHQIGSLSGCGENIPHDLCTVHYEMSDVKSTTEIK